MKASPWRREFREKGYTVHRGLFGRSEVDQAVAAIEATAPAIERPSGLNTSRMIFYTNTFQRSEYIRSLLADPRIVSILTDIAGPDLWVRWDQTVAKGPGGEEFPWHQDNGYNQLKREHFQVWVALTEMTSENGYLLIEPESHNLGLLPHEKVGRHLVCARKPDKPRPIEADPGDVIVFSSLMLHNTPPNRSSGRRWAYVAEFMRMDQFDPFVGPPYFVAARGGRPDPRFVRSSPGVWRPQNQLLYLMPRLRNRLAAMRGRK
jgi:ectoine hydroxylase-related dioxygenase (phytanoyl-CoA dioxygenase family)